MYSAINEFRLYLMRRHTIRTNIVSLNTLKTCSTTRHLKILNEFSVKCMLKKLRFSDIDMHKECVICIEKKLF